MRDFELILGLVSVADPKMINSTSNRAGGPWRLHGLDLKSVLQGIADEVWPVLTSTVIPRQPFFDMMSVRHLTCKDVTHAWDPGHAETLGVS